MDNNPFDDFHARNRVCIKRALTRAGISIPKEIWYDEDKLLSLAKEHNIEPLKWEDIENSYLRAKEKEREKKQKDKLEIIKVTPKVDTSLFD